jgi:hypothetical protein
VDVETYPPELGAVEQAEGRERPVPMPSYMLPVPPPLTRFPQSSCGPALSELHSVV